MNLFDLSGRVVVMTGATGVLGKSISSYLALQGARIAILVRERSTLAGEALAEDIRAKGGDAASFVADVMDKVSLEAAYDKVIEKYGRVDVLMNAAGGNMPAATVSPDKTIFDLDTDAVKTVSDLNLFGTILPTMVFAKAMAQQKSGSIINFASESALRPLTRVAGYGVAKSAVVNWTKYLCAEMAMKFGEGIRVNAIAPGFILTDQNRSLLTNPDGSLTPRAQTIISHTPFGRFLVPDELLGTLHWLASDASKAVTGTVAVVDGGFDAFSI
ncbi:MAG: SDR family oxidoreductase [Bacteroidales bacterium]|nr:SDR family oxidoreductase [Bacteroidales bacterium]